MALFERMYPALTKVFDESKHRRDEDGRFAPKTGEIAGRSAGGALGALAGAAVGAKLASVSAKEIVNTATVVGAAIGGAAMRMTAIGASPKIKDYATLVGAVGAGSMANTAGRAVARVATSPAGRHLAVAGSIAGGAILGGKVLGAAGRKYDDWAQARRQRKRAVSKIVRSDKTGRISRAAKDGAVAGAGTGILAGGILGTAVGAVGGYAAATAAARQILRSNLPRNVKTAALVAVPFLAVSHATAAGMMAGGYAGGHAGGRLGARSAIRREGGRMLDEQVKKADLADRFLDAWTGGRLRKAITIKIDDDRHNDGQDGRAGRDGDSDTVLREKELRRRGSDEGAPSAGRIAGAGVAGAVAGAGIGRHLARESASGKAAYGWRRAGERAMDLHTRAAQSLMNAGHSASRGRTALAQQQINATQRFSRMGENIVDRYVRRSFRGISRAGRRGAMIGAGVGALTLGGLSLARSLYGEQR